MIARGFDIMGKIISPNPQDKEEIAWEIITTVCGGFMEYIKDGQLQNG